MMEEKITLKLSKAEALVLFELSGRLNDMNEDALTHIYTDPAEMALMWNIEAALESLLAEPFHPDYAKMIEKAKAKLRQKAGL